MSNTPINWQQKKCGDWFANPECGYHLIVEKLDDGYSWQLNHQGDIVDDSWLIGDRDLNRTEAFAKAEAAFKKHYNQFSDV